MPKLLRILILAPPILLAGPSPAFMLAAAADPAPRTRIVVQEEHPWVRHSVADGTYQVGLAVQHCLVGHEQFDFEVISLEDGIWENSRCKLGQLLKLAPVWVSVNPVSTQKRSPALSGRLSKESLTVEVAVAGQSHKARVLKNRTWELAAATIQPELAAGIYDVHVTVKDEQGHESWDNTTSELRIGQKGPAPRRTPIRVLGKHRILRQFELQPQVSRQQFEEEMQQIRAAAQKEVDVLEEQGRFERNSATAVEGDSAEQKAAAMANRIRLAAVQRIKFLSDVRNRPLRTLNGPQFAKRRINPERDLEDLLRWIELDRLLTQTGLVPAKNLNELELLKWGDELMDVLAGRPRDRPFEHLSAEYVVQIRKAVSFTYKADFIPRLAGNRPDHGWLYARRVAFQPGVVGSVRWQVPLGGGALAVQWLAYQLPKMDEPLQVDLPGKSDRVAWCTVASASAWRYIRVVARNPREASDLVVELSHPKIDGHPVEVSQQAKGPLRFPF